MLRRDANGGQDSDKDGKQMFVRYVPKVKSIFLVQKVERKVRGELDGQLYLFSMARIH